MYSGRSCIDLDGLVDFRRRLMERIDHLSAQENATKKALDIISQTWEDDNFRKFESEFSQDVERINALVEDLIWFDNPILENFQRILEEYLSIDY